MTLIDSRYLLHDIYSCDSTMGAVKFFMILNWIPGVLVRCKNVVLFGKNIGFDTCY